MLGKIKGKCESFYNIVIIKYLQIDIIINVI